MHQWNTTLENINNLVRKLIKSTEKGERGNVKKICFYVKKKSGI